MMKGLFLATLLLTKISLATTVVEQKDTCTNGHCGESKVYAQVCVKNVDSGHHIGVITTWNLDDRPTRNWIRLGSSVLYRLTLIEEDKDAKFEITFAKGPSSKEGVTMPLDFAWSKQPSNVCAELPSYEFKLAKAGEQTEFSLIKSVPVKP